MTGSRWLAVVLLSLLSLLSGLSGSASADRRAATKAEVEARNLYEQGVKYYNLAQYDQAIESFKASYLISKVPSLLFNVAQSYRQQGTSGCGLALKFYQSYLREKPDAPDRKIVEERIAEMNRCESEESKKEAAPPASPMIAAPPTATAPPPPAPRPAWYGRTGWALFGAGLGVAAIGAGLLGSTATGLDSCSPQCSPSRVDGLRARANAGYALTAVGGAAVAAGIVVLSIGHRRSPAQARLMFGPLHAAWVGTF